MRTVNLFTAAVLNAALFGLANSSDIFDPSEIDSNHLKGDLKNAIMEHHILTLTQDDDGLRRGSWHYRRPEHHLNDDHHHHHHHHGHGGRGHHHHHDSSSDSSSDYDSEDYGDEGGQQVPITPPTTQAFPSPARPFQPEPPKEAFPSPARPFQPAPPTPQPLLQAGPAPTILAAQPVQNPCIPKGQTGVTGDKEMLKIDLSFNPDRFGSNFRIEGGIDGNPCLESLSQQPLLQAQAPLKMEQHHQFLQAPAMEQHHLPAQQPSFSQPYPQMQMEQHHYPTVTQMEQHHGPSPPQGSFDQYDQMFGGGPNPGQEQHHGQFSLPTPPLQGSPPSPYQSYSQQQPPPESQLGPYHPGTQMITHPGQQPHPVMTRHPLSPPNQQQQMTSQPSSQQQQGQYPNAESQPQNVDYLSLSQGPNASSYSSQSQESQQPQQVLSTAQIEELMAIERGEMPLNYKQQAQSQQKQASCRANTYVRETGHAPNVCPENSEQVGMTCLEKCRGDYIPQSPNFCLQKCTSNQIDEGAFCKKGKQYSRGHGLFHQCQNCEKIGNLWYQSCAPGFTNVGCCSCSPVCSRGQTDVGLSCAKHAYKRMQHELQCAENEEFNGSICIEKCRAGYENNGYFCAGKCPSGTSPCGIFCLAAEDQCTDALNRVQISDFLGGQSLDMRLKAAASELMETCPESDGYQFNAFQQSYQEPELNLISQQEESQHNFEESTQNQRSYAQTSQQYSYQAPKKTTPQYYSLLPGSFS